MIGYLRRTLAEHLPPDIVTRILAALRESFGGERHYINAPEDTRRLEALALLKNGRTVAEVASKLGVSQATVYRWHAARRKAEGRSDARKTGMARKPDWYL